MSDPEAIEQIVDAVFQNDTNGNGLTKDEIAKMLNESDKSDSVTQFMEACDKDGDGVVTKDEFREILKASMAKQ